MNKSTETFKGFRILFKAHRNQRDVLVLTYWVSDENLQRNIRYSKLRM